MDYHGMTAGNLHRHTKNGSDGAIQRFEKGLEGGGCKKTGPKMQNIFASQGLQSHSFLWGHREKRHKSGMNL